MVLAWTSKSYLRTPTGKVKKCPGPRTSLLVLQTKVVENSNKEIKGSQEWRKFQSEDPAASILYEMLLKSGEKRTLSAENSQEGTQITKKKFHLR